MEQKRYVNLGWGVNSMTVAAMVALGVLPPVEAAIHADTTHELEATYRYARTWTPWLEARGVQVVTVQGKRTDVIRADWGKTGANEYTKVGVMIPAFTKAHADGKHGQTRRQCTQAWKIDPARKYIRAQLGHRPSPGEIVQLIGFSYEEWRRVRDNDVKYIINEYPLIELGMNRSACIAYLEQQGLEIPPKSACTFCPYHSLDSWKRLKEAGGADWDEAVAVDADLRHRRDILDVYLHPARVPLAEAVQTPADTGQLRMEIDFEHPCDGGYCYV